MMTSFILDVRYHLTRFARNEDGSQTVEAMLMIPLWVWSFLATWVFFDAYRVQSINAKAAYTIGDIISRQQAWITPEFIDSMHLLQQSLVDNRTMPRLRVTTFAYDMATDAHYVCWSETRGSGGDLTNARLAAMRGAIPTNMFDGEVGIIVQTSVDYEPMFAAGISQMDFDDFVITSPRVGIARFNTVNAGGGQSEATGSDCTIS